MLQRKQAGPKEKGKFKIVEVKQEDLVKNLETRSNKNFKATKSDNNGQEMS